MTDNKQDINTVVEAFDLPLTHPFYNGLAANLSFDIRDFEEGRTLVVSFTLDDKVFDAFVPWAEFTESFDAMRARMFAGNWDDALAQMNERGN